MNTAKGKLWLEEADPGYPGSSWWHVGDTNLDDLFEPLEGQEVVVTISIVEPTEETSSSQQRVMLHWKVDADGCWTWTRALSHNGYGFITINTRQRRAARVSYEVFRGPIPAGFQIDHLCRNRACVNPQHLEAVTQQENIRRSDGIQATNARKTHCKRGHEFTADNTIRQGPNGKDRRCRTCRDVYMREWKARQ